MNHLSQLSWVSIELLVVSLVGGSIVALDLLRNAQRMSPKRWRSAIAALGCCMVGVVVGAL